MVTRRATVEEVLRNLGWGPARALLPLPGTLLRRRAWRSDLQRSYAERQAKWPPKERTQYVLGAIGGAGRRANLQFPAPPLPALVVWDHDRGRPDGGVALRVAASYFDAVDASGACPEPLGA